MDLPSFGTFTVDEKALAASLDNKQGTIQTDFIQFTPKPSLQESPELIAFTSKITGKMRPLAASDLESYLQLAHQFINIGKPFVIEDVGSIFRKNNGALIFTPANIPIDNIKHLIQTADVETKIVITEISEDKPTSVDMLFEPKKKALKWVKTLLGVLLFMGIGVGLWWVSMRFIRDREGKSDKETTSNSISDKNAVNDALSGKNPAIETTPAAISNRAADEYKYIIEDTTKVRALARFSQLKGYGWNLQMETTDSIRFKIFLLQKNADTTAVRDSIFRLLKNPVRVEK